MNGFNTKPDGGRVQGWALYTQGVKLILGCGMDVRQLLFYLLYIGAVVELKKVQNQLYACFTNLYWG